MFELDYETVDKWFEAGYQSGSHIRFGIFDKRILLSHGQVLSGCQQELTFEDLTSMAARGWIPMFSNDIYPEGNGFPLYVPSRIDMLLELEREGYSAEELREIAEFEEYYIDFILTTGEDAYIDDDLELLILDRECELEGCQLKLLPLKPGERDRLERELRSLRQFQNDGIPERHQYRVEKSAFRLRAFNENFRITLLEEQRAKFRAGYSPSVRFLRYKYSPAERLYKDITIDWCETIESAAAYAEGDQPTIRVPGFLLCGDEVVSTRTLTPKAYEELWKQHDLAQYLLTWSHVQGEKRCLNCLAKFTESSSCRKKFCDEKCRNASKQKRYRKRNPEAVQETQRRYWSQFDDQLPESV